MSEGTVFINMKELLGEILPDKSKRELNEGQKLCSRCKGLGLEVRDIYLQNCSVCRGGVVDACRFCGKEYSTLGGYRRNLCCEGAKIENELDKHKERLEHLKKQEERITTLFNKAEKITIKEAKDRGIEVLFNEDAEHYMSISEAFDHFDNELDDELSDNRVKWLFATKQIKMSIDADDIVDSACEELHEDARDWISKQDIEELQGFLDNWCEKQTGTISYEPDYKVVVILGEEV